MVRTNTNLRLFQPGQSGNPRGRPKRDADIAELARAHTEDAIAALADIMANNAAPPSARVSAATALLDRGWGKAPQSLDVSHHPTMAKEFETFIRSLNGGRGPSVLETATGGDHD